jgi:hypothetical protein
MKKTLTTLSFLIMLKSITNAQTKFTFSAGPTFGKINASVGVNREDNTKPKLGYAFSTDVYLPIKNGFELQTGAQFESIVSGLKSSQTYALTNGTTFSNNVIKGKF